MSNIKLLSPFGPKVGQVKVPDNILDRINTLIDDMMLTKHSQPDLPRFLLEHLSDDETQFLHNTTKDFVNSCINNQELYLSSQCAYQDDKSKQHYRKYNFTKNHILHTEIDQVWASINYENDYNASHDHPTNTVSGVFYLNVPQFKQRTYKEYKGNILDGQIEFINNSCGGLTESLEISSFSIEPRIGYLYIFPARLQHIVYPFKGEGERRAVSFNMRHWFGEKK